jgi:hypothetical protein
MELGPDELIRQHGIFTSNIGRGSIGILMGIITMCWIAIPSNGKITAEKKGCGLPGQSPNQNCPFQIREMNKGNQLRRIAELQLWDPFLVAF